MIMKGKLKGELFYVGNGVSITLPSINGIVDIVDVEYHYIYGKRYKIAGCNEWLEENCFKYVGDDE